MQIAVHSLEMYEMPGINWKTRDLYMYINIYFNGIIFIEQYRNGIKQASVRVCVCVFNVNIYNSTTVQKLCFLVKIFGFCTRFT